MTWENSSGRYMPKSFFSMLRGKGKMQARSRVERTGGRIGGRASHILSKPVDDGGKQESSDHIRRGQAELFSSLGEKVNTSGREGGPSKEERDSKLRLTAPLKKHR